MQLQPGCQLYCWIAKEKQLAAAQVNCLRTFLSTDFPSSPISSVVLNGVCYLSPAEIIDFIHLIDKLGCRSASIMSPYSEYERPHVTPTPGIFNHPPPHCPRVTLSNLARLELDTTHFENREWSYFLQCLTVPKLISLSVRGPPPHVSFVRFLSRHPSIQTVEALSCWGDLVRARNNGLPVPQFPQNVIRMPHLEKLDGPPCHLISIVKCLIQPPKVLAIHFTPEREDGYWRYCHQLLETVHLCDGEDAKLDISIQFRQRHFELEECFEMDLASYRKCMGPVCRGAKSLCLFLPDLSDTLLLVSFLQYFYLIPILILSCFVETLHAVAQHMVQASGYSGPPQSSRILQGLSFPPRMGFAIKSSCSRGRSMGR